MSEPINVVRIDRLGATVQAVHENPDLARFQFRTKNKWINGGHNRSTIRTFYGAGQEDTVRTKPFVLDAADPPVLLGEDQAANPAEYVLHALAACLTTSLVYHAAARGIRIESVESYLEGELDLRGFLGISDDVRKGFQQIRTQFKIKSDAGPGTAAGINQVLSSLRHCCKPRCGVDLGRTGINTARVSSVNRFIRPFFANA